MMRTGILTDEFKRDAVAQITARDCPTKEVSGRIGVGQHSLLPGCASPGIWNAGRRVLQYLRKDGVNYWTEWATLPAPAIASPKLAWHQDA